MKQAKRVGLVLAVLCATTGGSVGAMRAMAVSESVTINVESGDDGNAIAEKFRAAWSDGGAFTCGGSGNVLTATESPQLECDDATSEYEFVNDAASDAHTMELEVSCASPLVARVDLDSAGFVTLALGTNVFQSGPDTFVIDHSIPGTVPAIPNWGLVLLPALLFAGAVMLHFRMRAAPAS